MVGLAGDLAEPRFGIPRLDFETLVQRLGIEAIFHVGAWVHGLYVLMS